MTEQELPQDAREKIGKLDVGLGFLSQEEGSCGDHPADLPQRAQVVIVGAGLAGLAAAQRLHENGFQDVIILDALNRVGGRVQTIKHSNYLLELGAQWLHGAYDNPLYQWLTGLEMLDDFEDASWGFNGAFCISDSDGEISMNLVQKVLKILNECKSSLFNNFRKSRHSNDESVSQVFWHHLEKSMGADRELANNKHLVHAIFEWFLRFETIENCCDNMDEVSIRSYTDWTDLGDGALLNFKDGYQSLLKWFCERFPRKQWLHLNKQVLNVEVLNSATVTSAMTCPVARGQTHCSPVLVRYKDLRVASDGRAAKRNQSSDECQQQIKTIECNHVIVTVSLGFLKSHSKAFFTPQLPAYKQELIDSIGFGTVNKILLQFDAPFWSPTSGGIKLVWRDEDFLVNNTDQSDSCLPSWARDILAFDVVRRQPNLLIGWIGGLGAKAIELESDERVGQICLQVLEKFLPRSHPRPTKLVTCLCSRWHSNPFTCGSYSFQSMKSVGLNLAKLHEPIYDNQHSTVAATTTSGNQLGEKFSLDSNNNWSSSGLDASPSPCIMFAGEATAGNQYSTAHGAVISGWREADRLRDHLMFGKRVDD